MDIQKRKKKKKRDDDEEDDRGRVLTVQLARQTTTINNNQPSYKATRTQSTKGRRQRGHARGFCCSLVLIFSQSTPFLATSYTQGLHIMLVVIAVDDCRYR
jgi:predicted ABC-type ATPase